MISVCILHQSEAAKEHSVGRTLTFDQSVNSYIMIVNEDFFKVQSEFSVQSTIKKHFLIGDQYETIYRAVRTQCSSCRVMKQKVHIDL